MGVIEDVFGKEPSSIDLNDIDSLIKQKREESRNLEYKAPDILNRPVDLSKWVSAMLNADGGLIILGVCEDKPERKDRINAKIYPTRIEFVTEEYPKERIEQLIFGNIRSSTKPDLRIYPIRNPNDHVQAVYLVEITQGDNPPYQAADDKYYRRLNATKYSMPHSEIADFFGRRRKPRLTLDNQIMSVDVNNSTFYLRIFVCNEGKAVARYARVYITFENNIEIEDKILGNLVRIDDLRGGKPALQWDNSKSVIHPVAHRIRIADLRLRLLQPQEISSISWETIAEDQELISGNYTLYDGFLNRSKELLDDGQTIYMQ